MNIKRGSRFWRTGGRCAPLRLSVSAAIALLPLLVAPMGPAYAHSWYDYDCCDTRDCRPAKPDEVQVVPQGFIVRSGNLVREFSRTEFRQSQDSEFHICVTPLLIRCLYVPGGGV